MTNPRGRDELSQTLRRLRHDAGVTAAQVAGRTGFSQAKISRFETGKFVPPPEAAEAIARAVGAPAAELRRVVALAADVREQISPRLVLLRDAAKMQQRIDRIEEQSTHIGTFSPTLVPGLLQTEEYMRVVFASALAPEEVEPAVAVRAGQRQRRLRAGGPHRYTQIATEGALTWHVGDPGLMARQLDHLAALARDDEAVRVGVIPVTTAVRQFPLQAFDVYDHGRAVLMGTFTATALMTQPVDVAAYQGLFEQMEALADFDEAAVSTFQRLARRYREMADAPGRLG